MLDRVRRKKRVLPFVLLAFLVAVNAYLIALLLRPEPEISAEPAAQSSQSSTPTATPSASLNDPEPSPSPSSPSPSPSPTADVIPSKRLLFAASDREAWRATVGDCKTSGTVERSTDGGKTWRRAINSGLAPIVRLGLDGAGNVYTIGGAGDACSTRYTAYTSEGAVSESTDNPINLWFSRPKDRDQIYGPGNNEAAPCDGSHVVGMSSLTVSDSEALVICTDGLAMVTSDSGKTWEKADQLPGTMAVGSGGGRYWVAGTTAKCDGISVRSLEFSEGELTRGPSSCAPASKVTPGGVAIDFSDKAIWVWAGQKVRTSTDGGQTWT
jgi:hypothetical protein